MPREARFFASSARSVVRGFLKFRGTPLDRNAQRSRKRIEPEIAGGPSLKRLRIRRPRAQVAIRNGHKGLRSVLDRWETAYRKENFCRGIRILLEFRALGNERYDDAPFKDRAA
jgi:hypothetical protein